MKLKRTKDTTDQYAYDQYEQELYNPRRPRRFGRQARETVVMCILAGLIAALAWGLYKWTNASRFTPRSTPSAQKGINERTSNRTL